MVDFGAGWHCFRCHTGRSYLGTFFFWAKGFLNSKTDSLEIYQVYCITLCTRMDVSDNVSSCVNLIRLYGLSALSGTWSVNWHVYHAKAEVFSWKLVAFYKMWLPSANAFKVCHLWLSSLTSLVFRLSWLHPKSSIWRFLVKDVLNKEKRKQLNNDLGQMEEIKQYHVPCICWHECVSTEAWALFS